jgi:hypothetical protein
MTDERHALMLRHALVLDSDSREMERSYTDPDRVKAQRKRIEALWAKREEQLAALKQNAQQVRRFARR